MSSQDTDAVGAGDPTGTGTATDDAAGRDSVVPLRVFLAIGVFMVVIAGIYWATAYEEGGVVMLLLAGALALWIATYLWLRVRAASAAAEGAEPPGGASDGYEPHASVWPFTIGLGAATMANGLALGLWVLVPGAVLLAVGVGGFVRQTRRRD
jgi:hypothetical protein